MVKVLGREPGIEIDEELADLLFERHRIDGAAYPGHRCGVQEERLYRQINHATSV